MTTPSSDSADASVKVILFALFANFGIAISKFGGWILTGSASLLAEGIHSVADCTNQVLLLVGNKAARKPPTPTHPFGYGKESFFWSFVVALVLFSMGGLFSIYEGVHKLQSTDPIDHPWVGLTILALSIALETGSFWACYKEVKKQNPYPSLTQWVRKTTAAELLVIFIEDLAALLGLVFAFICLLLAYLSGNPVWDAIGSLAIGVLLVAVAFVLARETKSLLIGEAPSQDYEPVIRKIIDETAPGVQMIRFVSQQVGASQVLISMKVHPGPITDVSTLVDKINEIERRIKSRFPDIQWQFIEPDTQS